MRKTLIPLLFSLALLSSCSFNRGPSPCTSWRTTRVDGKVGFETPSGKEMIPPQFDGAWRFNENCFAEVRKTNANGSDLKAYIDSTGALRTEWCNAFRELENGTYIATKGDYPNRKSRLLGTDLQPLSEWYDDIRTFEQGLLQVYRNEEGALMNAEGKVLSEFAFTSFEMLENHVIIGEYWKDRDHRQALVDTAGNLLSDGMMTLGNSRKAGSGSGWIRRVAIGMGISMKRVNWSSRPFILTLTILRMAWPRWEKANLAARWVISIRREQW